MDNHVGVFQSIIDWSPNLLILLKGAGWSIVIAVCAMLIGLVLGTCGAAFKISKNKVLNFIAFVYVEFIRGTPMLLQIMFIAIGFPVLYTMIFGGHITPSPIIVGIIAMGINSGAYSTELIRSGIQSINKGQWEASKSIGLNYGQTMRYIILPQVFKLTLPPLVSEVIVLIKDSSLIYAIGGLELLGQTKVIGSRTYDYLSPLLIATVYYLIMTMTVSYLARKLERRLRIND